MDVVFDGEKGVVTVPEGASYQSIFDSIAKAASSRKRIVLTLTLDGTPLAPGQQKSMADQVPPAAARLEVTTQAPRELAVGTLAGLIELVPTIEKLHDRGGEQVVAASYKDAMKTFDECFLGWQAITSPVAYIANLVPLDLKTVKVGEETAHARVDKVGEALQKFKTAFTQKDVVRIGDVAQYELRPLLGEWREVLEALSKSISEGQGTGR